MITRHHVVGFVAAIGLALLLAWVEKSRRDCAHRGGVSTRGAWGNLICVAPLSRAVPKPEQQ